MKGRVMSIDLISIERQCESEPSAVDINVGDLLVAYLEQLKVEYVLVFRACY